MHDSSPASLADQLLDWYDRHGRDLPWRARHGRRPDPYAVWLSEVMLQQTTVATVGPYFARFLERWPDVAALARAPLDDVLVAWAGLGYYARARNLHRCAQAVASRPGGGFPDQEADLRQLPGIGDYTAAAIAAIAFDHKAVVMDGNIERVMARLFAVQEPLPAAKPALKARAARLTPAVRPGDYAQAAMDLGATICTPRKPACGLCPWRGDCRALALGIADQLPAKPAKADRPVRHAVAFWLQRADGAVLLRRRPERGLLGGMMEIPSTDWRTEPWSWPDALAAAPLPAEWQRRPGIVAHTFTHFHLLAQVAVARTDGAGIAGAVWCLPSDFRQQALPTVIRKWLRHVMEQ